VTVPSFVGLKPASSASSRSKRSNKSLGTAHEAFLMARLKSLGFKFECNVRSLPGKPDIAFLREKIAVFCDGDFWHGRNWNSLRHKLARGSNGKYWKAKIQSNIQRDKRINRELTSIGFDVIRIWESDIIDNYTQVLERVELQIQQNKKRGSSK